MIVLFLILIVIASVGLAFMVLVQNPKGGGLSGNVEVVMVLLVLQCFIRWTR